jgi:Arc/MetJ-type ribon-helix-helix transcriptional regulator
MPLDYKYKLLTINIPAEYVNILDFIVSIGLFGNRSEAIRKIVNNKIKREIQHLKTFEFWPEQLKRYYKMKFGDKLK